MKVHRRGMQRQQQRRGFDRAGEVSEVLAGKISKRKLAVVQALPEEIVLDAARQCSA
jgi:hypothetical protein